MTKSESDDFVFEDESVENEKALASPTSIMTQRSSSDFLESDLTEMLEIVRHRDEQKRKKTKVTAAAPEHNVQSDSAGNEHTAEGEPCRRISDPRGASIYFDKPRTTS